MFTKKIYICDSLIDWMKNIVDGAKDVKKTPCTTCVRLASEYEQTYRKIDCCLQKRVPVEVNDYRWTIILSGSFVSIYYVLLQTILHEQYLKIFQATTMEIT